MNTLHRIDLVLPEGRLFYFPISDIKGQNLIDFLKKFSFENYVICRNSSTQNQYDIIYSTNIEKIPISSLFTEPFPSTLISKYFVSDRNVSSRQQSMPMFVFLIDDFLYQNSILTSSISLSSFSRKHIRYNLRVQLPTRVSIDIEIKPTKSISSITKLLYEKLNNLYENSILTTCKLFRFGTINGEYPSTKLKFSECPIFMAAYRKQLLNPLTPQFIYSQLVEENEFSLQSQTYISELDLKPILSTSEVLALNSSLSELRQNVESSRLAKLNNNPLLARMRINSEDPPLMTCKRKNVPIKAEMRSAEIDSAATGVSIAIQFETTASQAIRDLFSKMGSIQGIGKGLNPDDFALVLQGTDEIVAGEYRFDHFVCVRQFLVSVTPFMNFLLVEKKGLIESIKSKELSYQQLKEPSNEQLYRPIGFNKELKPTCELMPAFPHSLAKENLSIHVGGCFMIPSDSKGCRYVVKASLIFGANEITDSVTTQPAVGETSVSWNETISINIPIQRIPNTARLSLTLHDYDRIGKKDSAIATLNYPIFTFDGWFNSGMSFRSMWNGKDSDPILTTCECEEEKSTKILFTIPDYRFPISFIKFPPIINIQTLPKMNLDQKKVIDKLIKPNYNPLEPLSNEEKNILWKYRYELIQYPSILPHVLSCIDYTSPSQILEIPSLLNKWKKLSPTDALCLLDSQYADSTIRSYAVSCLEPLSEDELMLYMLQLIQALKYEIYDDSDLCKFLFRRGLAEPKFLGHSLFWQLISEAHLSHIRRRFSSFVVNFLYGIGHYRDELLKGYKFTQELVRLNQSLGKLSHSEATEPFREALRKIDLPNEFHLPMDPRLIVDSFIVEKCRVMNSKKKPFWLTFKNAAPFATEPIRILFKVGDDLRQDQLTLQVMKVMEHLWRKNGLDLHMRCYGVLPTGFNQGFIEVVPNAITEQELQQNRGLMSGIWDKTTITDYLIKVNQSEANINQARLNFMYSSAGYAVSTCVLGVADRHPGNIMLQSDGHFLHIDFGHFLGNFKVKLGYQRENAPFHFSPACANVLGDVEGELFKQFKQLCGKSLNILRSNTQLLVTLFMLMLGTGIPELQHPKDIIYLTKMLYLDLTDEEAENEFEKLTLLSLDSTKTKLNNLFHNIAVSG